MSPQCELFKDQACVTFTLFQDGSILVKTLDGNDKDLNDSVDGFTKAFKATWDAIAKKPCDGGDGSGREGGEGL